MSFIRSLFFGMRPIWTVGVPVFTLFFFLPYWFILCPILWDRNHEMVGNNRSGINLWLFSYWLVAVVVWATVFSIAFYFWKQKKQDCDESDLGFDQHLLSSQHSKTPIPFSLTSLSIQPNYCNPTKKIEKEVTPLQTQISEVDISCKSVQPLTLKTTPSTRPSESDFTWDNDDISWLSENDGTTSPPHLKSITERNIEIALEISSVASSPQDPENEDSQQDFEYLGIEYRSDYYQLTPTGSPPDSPSFTERFSGVENPASEMEDSVVEKK